MHTRYKPRRANDEFYEYERAEPFQVMGAPINTAYVVHIDENFENVKQFENIVRVLDQAKEGDVFEIKLSTNGGALHAILPLLAAIQNTQAQVYVHAVSDVASAGTFVLLAADDVFINPYTTIMFHQVQFGSAGAGSSVEAHVNHTMKASKVLMHDMYKDFFSEDEIEQMLSGRDFYMGKEEFDARYDRRYEIRQERIEAKLAEITGGTAKPKKRAKKRVTPALAEIPEE